MSQLMFKQEAPVKFKYFEFCFFYLFVLFIDLSYMIILYIYFLFIYLLIFIHLFIVFRRAPSVSTTSYRHPRRSCVIVLSRFVLVT